MSTKAERQLNLLAFLREALRPQTAEEIRRKIPDYRDEPSEEAFRRMFERDKAELRDLGVEIESAPVDAWDPDTGYRIAEGSFLEDPGLTPPEIAALSLAAQAWAGDVGGSGPAVAVLKLTLGEARPAGRPWIRPRVTRDDRNLAVVYDAVARRKTIRFAYRRRGGEPAAGRVLDPYELINRGSSWYVAGRDHARGEPRRFKLSRIEGAVKKPKGSAPDFDPPSPGAVQPLRLPWEGDSDVEARIAFSPKVAWWAERRTGGNRIEERGDGWVVLAVPVVEAEPFIGWLLGFGPDAELLEPADLRAEMVARLEGLVR